MTVNLSTTSLFVALMVARPPTTSVVAKSSENDAHPVGESVVVILLTGDSFHDDLLIVDCRLLCLVNILDGATQSTDNPIVYTNRSLRPKNFTITDRSSAVGLYFVGCSRSFV